MRRTIALVSILILGFAAPVFAQTGVSAKVTSPSDGATVNGYTGVTATASASTGVRNARMFIGDTLVASAEPSNLRQSVDLNHNWDTASSFFGGSSRNGWYQIRVEVTATGGGSSTSKIDVMVDNPAQSPGNFAGYVQDDTVHLSWAPNPEPDLIGYRVEIAEAGTWTLAAETTATTYGATLQPGTYQYRVLAVRSSPTSAGQRVSEASPAVTLTIAAPETSGAGGSVSGPKGGRGAVGGGDPRVYGRDGAASTRDVKNTARAFSSGGLSFGGLSLPGQAGLPDLPSTAPFEWGSFKERLPYSLPEGGVALDAAPQRLAAVSTTTIIPMDALRWVGAGTLMIVLAVMVQFFGWRADTIARLGSEGADALRLTMPRVSIPNFSIPKVSIPNVSVPAVSLQDAHVRLRRIQDRVRTTWSKARRS